jgi:hypothetical protein
LVRRADGLDQLVQRLLIGRSQMRVPAINQRDRAPLLGTIPGLVAAGVVEHQQELDGAQECLP